MMNIPFLAAALLLTVAFLAHLLVGTRETQSLSPAEEKQTEQKRRNWIQALCAFQLVSVDLLLLAIAAYLLAATQILEARREIACFMAAHLGTWGVAWLVQLKAVGAGSKNYYLLGQWILFFLCAALMAWGAQQV